MNRLIENWFDQTANCSEQAKEQMVLASQLSPDHSQVTSSFSSNMLVNEDELEQLDEDSNKKPTSTAKHDDQLQTMFMMAGIGSETVSSVPSSSFHSLPSSSSFTSTPYHPILMMKMMMLDKKNSTMAESSSSLASFKDLALMTNPLTNNQTITFETESHSESFDEKPETTSSILPKARIRRCQTFGKSFMKPYSVNRRLVASTVSTGQKHNAMSQKMDITQMSRSNPVYRCHLCSYTGDSKLHFNAHMNTHFDHRCPHCDYTSRTEGRLKRHIRDFHSESPPDSWTGAGKVDADNGLLMDIDPLDVNFDEMVMSAGGTGPNPARNRKYRCKQCGYVAVDKHDFWEHSKDHIKSDKMLACPKCNFVTEYKHHLEYHLRNHFGSKPFKCAKCNYSCVNKSMLNSHMKSHSNIYQYRCEDCTYATKYCHSLKLHLRKYQHQPATVLNLDGTPNPYPVIDVYGTRRGPRPKKSKTSSAASQQDNNIKKKKQRASIHHSKQVKSMFVMGDSVSSSSSLSVSSSSCSDSSESSVERREKLRTTTPSFIGKSSPEKGGSGSEELINSKSQQTSSTNDAQCSVQPLLKCNYCKFQTESKVDFSNHLLNHVINEKISLLNKKRIEMMEKTKAQANCPESCSSKPLVENLLAENSMNHLINCLTNQFDFSSLVKQNEQSINNNQKGSTALDLTSSSLMSGSSQLEPAINTVQTSNALQALLLMNSLLQLNNSPVPVEQDESKEQFVHKPRKGKAPEKVASVVEEDSFFQLDKASSNDDDDDRTNEAAFDHQKTVCHDRSQSPSNEYSKQTFPSHHAQHYREHHLHNRHSSPASLIKVKVSQPVVNQSEEEEEETGSEETGSGNDRKSNKSMQTSTTNQLQLLQMFMQTILSFNLNSSIANPTSKSVNLNNNQLDAWTALFEQLLFATTGAILAPSANISIEQWQNVNNLINKMFSATSLMQEILVEMCTIKK